MFFLRKQKSSILLFTLLILSLITFLTQQFVRNVLIGTRFDKGMIAREQARVLALSGVNFAISQLTLREPKKVGLQEKKDPDQSVKDFLTRILPNLNKWQVFNLQENIDHIEGQIKFCITCENGKIDINEAFDFEKQEFKKDFGDLIKGLYIKGKLAEGEILKKLTEFLKDRKKKLDDISELIGVPGLEFLDVYYKPPKITKLNKKSKPNADITLQDFFTVSTSSDKIELLFFSDSLLAVFGLRRPVANDAKVLKDKYKELIQNFKRNLGADWEKNWTYMQTIYGSEINILKRFSGILSKEFEPRVYSVLSCGKVKGVKQKLLAIIKEEEKKEESKESMQKKEENKEVSSKKFFKILKLYWI